MWCEGHRPPVDVNEQLDAFANGDTTLHDFSDAAFINFPIDEDERLGAPIESFGFGPIGGKRPSSQVLDVRDSLVTWELGSLDLGSIRSTLGRPSRSSRWVDRPPSLLRVAGSLEAILWPLGLGRRGCSILPSAL